MIDGLQFLGLQPNLSLQFVIELTERLLCPFSLRDIARHNQPHRPAARMHSADAKVDWQRILRMAVKKVFLLRVKAAGFLDRCE